MKLEITPWKGKFHAYLLEYKTANETIIGAKEEAFIFLTDLVFEDKNYQNGKIFFDINSKEYCGISLKMIGDNQLKVTYNCDGQQSEEFWYREGTNIPVETVETPTVVPTKNKAEEIASKEKGSPPAKNVTTKKDRPSGTPNDISPVKSKKTSAQQVEGETKKQSTFFVIGIQDVAEYGDIKNMEKIIEELWNRAYNNDFSSKLKNIIDPNSMHLTYSNYNNLEGKMTVTLGYKVKDLTNIPSGLKGVRIPSNEYLVYPMLGDKSDFEGDGWEQLGELMKHRKADSADIEIYNFDNSYNVKKAEMWIATT